MSDLFFALANCTIWFLKDIQHQVKKHVLNDQIKTIYVPQYEGLYLRDIENFCQAYPHVGEYLPDAPDIPKTPKPWIVNICAAVIGQPFRDWVAAQAEANNVKMSAKKNDMISMDPAMAAKLMASTHVTRKYPLLHLIALACFASLPVHMLQIIVFIRASGLQADFQSVILPIHYHRLAWNRG